MKKHSFWDRLAKACIAYEFAMGYEVPEQFFSEER